MFEKGKEDLIEYFFRFMITKELITEFLAEKDITLKANASYEKIAKKLREEGKFVIKLEEVIEFSRRKWIPLKSGKYLADLKSGLLKGYNWHGARPSTLHLSFQEKVRLYCKGDISLKEYLEIGLAISKQEAFMVLTHDLCETHIIKSIPEVIPSVGNKSVSDFIFNGIPYDLKNSKIPNGWTMAEARKRPLDFVKSLYEGADTERLRKQAENSINDWGLNRFYVILDDAEDWFSKPEEILKRIIEECRKLGKPMKFHIEGLTILAQVVFIE